MKKLLNRAILNVGLICLRRFFNIAVAHDVGNTITGITFTTDPHYAEYCRNYNIWMTKLPHVPDEESEVIIGHTPN